MYLQNILHIYINNQSLETLTKLTIIFEIKNDSRTYVPTYVNSQYEYSTYKILRLINTIIFVISGVLFERFEIFLY